MPDNDIDGWLEAAYEDRTAYDDPSDFDAYYDPEDDEDYYEEDDA